MRRIPVVLIGVLFAAFTLGVLGASRAPVSDRAAFDAWLIHDETPVRAAAPQDVARAILANWRESITRMQDAGGLRPELLLRKGWTTVLGDSLASVAVARGLFIILTAAILYRLILRRVPLGGAITSGIALILTAAGGAPFFWPAPDYHPALDTLAEQRTLTEPVVTVFRPDSPLGFHHAQASVRPGIGIDFGWRGFASEELSASLDGLHGDVVWVLGDTGLSTTLSMIHDIMLSEGRTRDLCVRPTDRVVLARYVTGGSTDACA